MNVPRQLYEVDGMLKKIERLLPGYTLTFVARYTGQKELADADIILTRDSLDSAIEAIQKLKDRDPLFRSGDPKP